MRLITRGANNVCGSIWALSRCTGVSNWTQHHIEPRSLGPLVYLKTGSCCPGRARTSHRRSPHRCPEANVEIAFHKTNVSWAGGDYLVHQYVEPPVGRSVPDC